MKMKKAVNLIFLTLFVAMLVLPMLMNPIPVMAAEEVNFEVEDVVWGTPDNNPIAVTPGDVNVPLTIYVRNLSNSTLRGVHGQLNMSYPFTDYETGSNTSTATGQPVEQGSVLNQTGDILEMGSFTLTYYLNINENATKGTYTANLTITYYYYNDTLGIYLTGTPRTLTVNIIVQNRAPVIYSVNPSATTLTMQVGDSVNMTTKCGDPDNDTLSFEWRYDDGTIAETQNITFVAPDEIGAHTLEFRVSDGNLTTTRTWTINIQREINTDFNVSTQYITAGTMNTLIYTVKNNIWRGTVDINFAIQNPIVVKGNSSWTFENVQPNQTLTVTVTLYVPFSVYGNTLAPTLTVLYEDEFGNTYTDTYSAGLIVRGLIRMIVYDFFINPIPAEPGQKVEFGATILNKGNIGAYFTNATILPNDVLLLTPESNSYIGDVDANSPVPFTLFAVVKTTASNGTYPVTVSIYYEDDQFEAHTLNVTFLLTIAKLSQDNETSTTSEYDIQEILNKGGYVAIGGALFLVAFVILYSRKKEKEILSK